MRGDRPLFFCSKIPGIPFTPHARGSTEFEDEEEDEEEVYPACAGIDPTTVLANIATHCLPRMRGDRPIRYGGERNPISLPACVIDPRKRIQLWKKVTLHA